MSCCGGKRAQFTRTLAAAQPQPQPQPTAAAPRAQYVLDPRLHDAIRAYLARRAKRRGKYGSLGS